MKVSPLYLQCKRPRILCEVRLTFSPHFLLMNQNALSCFRILSVFLYPIIGIIIAGLCFAVKPARWSKKIPLIKSFEPFNATEDPYWVTHISDIHIAPHQPQAIHRLNTTLAYMKKTIEPIHYIFSGDLVDNYEEKEAPTRSYPNETHWKIYRSILEHNGINPGNGLFELYGNHDMFGIWEYDKMTEHSAVYSYIPQDNIWGYSRTRKGVRVIGFNPVNFPTGHGPQLFIPPVTGPELNYLDYMINKEHDDAKYTIVTLHYTMDLMFPMSKSDTGKNFGQLMDQEGDKKVIAFLNGHTHPKNVEPRHYGKNIEITAPAMRNNDGYGLMTIDNDRINYEWRYINDSKPAIVTYPTPDTLARDIKDEYEFDIRVLSFSGHATNFVVSGDHQCTLTKDRDIPDSNAHLYSCPAKFSKGKHSITITGDLEQTIEFTLGEDAPPILEKKKYDLVYWSVIVGAVIGYAINTVSMLFMLLPEDLTKFAEKAENWLLGKEEDPHYLLATLGGPILSGYRLKKLPIWYRVFVIIMFIWPIAFPIAIYRTEGHQTVLWLYGFVINGTYSHDIFSVAFVMIYILTTFVIVVDVLGLYPYKFNYLMIIDYIFDIAMFAGGEFFFHMYGADIAYDSLWGASFLFWIFPMINVLLCIYLFVYQKRKDIQSPERSDELSDVDEKEDANKSSSHHKSEEESV